MNSAEEQAGVAGDRRGESAPEAFGLGLELVPDACIAVDAEGRIVGINRAVEDLFGYSREEVLGQRVELLIPERFRHGHRQYRAVYTDAPRRRAMGTGLQLYGRRRDGSELPVDISLAPVPGAPLVVAAVRDVSDRVKAAADSAQLAAIVRSSRDAILTMTASGIVTAWNRGAEELLGTPAHEAVSTHISTWVPPEHSPALEEVMERVAQTGYAPPRDTLWYNSSGKEVDVAISMSPMIDERGELRGFSLFARDISERKAAEAAQVRQERWQAATAEIRMASLSDNPLPRTLELICTRAFELVGGIGAAIVAVGQEGLRVVAASGERRDGLVQQLGSDVIATGETGSSGSLMSLAAERAMGALAAPISLRSGGPESPRVLVVLFSQEAEAADELRRLVESMAGQTAVAVELHRAREARQRLLLSEDRERIAKDLHDLVIQRLFATGMRMESTQQLVSDDVVAGRLAEATAELDATIREVRTTIFALEAHPDAAAGLRGELVDLVSAATKSLGFHPSLQFEGPVDLVADDLRHQAVAVVREALSNVARHAHAASASVFVSAGDSFSITVEDSGVGLSDSHRGSGLANLRSRAEHLGGSLAIEHRAGGGTRVVWQVPRF